MSPKQHSFASSLLAVLCVGSFLAGCSGESEEGSQSDSELEPTSVTSPAEPVVESDQEIALAGLEQKWADNRRRVVDTITSAGYGINADRELVGPAGFTVDLNQCPQEWTDDAGVTDETIKLTQIIPRSGDQKSFGTLADGMAAYFDFINSSGGIDGRRIDFEVIDDGFDPVQTVDITKGLIETSDSFAVSTVGTQTSLAVYGDLNDACIPNPFVVSAHPAWGDPIGHPWTTGMQMSYASEAVMWGNWISQNLPADLPVTVGALVIDNDFGLSYSDAFETWADDNRNVVDSYVVVRHAPSSDLVREQVAEIAVAEPDVFIAMTTGSACLAAVRAVSTSGLRDVTQAQFLPTVCKNPSVYMVPAGPAADDFLVVDGGVKALNSRQYRDDPYNVFIREILDEAGLKSESGLTGSGAGQYGWAYVEALRIANDLPGGLSRSGFLLALRSLSLEHPQLADGVRFALLGNDDPFFIEGSQIGRYDATSGAWVPEGKIIDVNGGTRDCQWDRRQGCQ